jgi:hypothetical protein
MRIIRYILFVAIAYFMLTLAASAQAPDCPAGYVCITRQAAIESLQRDDHAKAVEAENMVLKQAVEDHKKIETDLKIELAKTVGTLTGSQQNEVANRAIIELLLKSIKKKCMPLSVCF